MLELKGCYYYPEQCFFICKVASLFLLSSINAGYKGHYDLAIGPFGIFLTSLNYWRKPVPNSWRRYLDMTCVSFVLSYQLIRAYNAEYYKEHYLAVVIGLSFYPLGNYFYKKKQYWNSIYSHSMIHVMANVSHFILCSGTLF